MECGPWCAYYDSEIPDRLCKDCPAYTDEDKLGRSIGNTDMFELVRRLALKREQVRRNKIPRLSDCPICSRHALFYNQIDDCFECLALECQHIIRSGTEEYQVTLLAILDQEHYATYGRIA